LNRYVIWSAATGDPDRRHLRVHADDAGVRLGAAIACNLFLDRFIGGITGGAVK
jgi:hypothetical protein